MGISTLISTTTADNSASLAIGSFGANTSSIKVTVSTGSFSDFVTVHRLSSGETSTAHGKSAASQYSQIQKSIAFESAKKQAIQLKKDAAMKKTIDAAGNAKSCFLASRCNCAVGSGRVTREGRWRARSFVLEQHEHSGFFITPQPS